MRRHFLKLHRHIVPHRENRGRPAFFEWKNVGAFALALSLLVVLVYRSQELLRTTNLGAVVIASDVLARENELRTKAHLPQLIMSTALTRAAEAKARDMIARGYFSHITTDGKTPWDFMSASGYEYQHAGENLALNFVESKDLVEAWLASPLHRENIVGVQFKETGIAVVEGEYEGKKQTFVVQMFGARAKTSGTPAREVDTIDISDIPSTGGFIARALLFAGTLPRAIIPALLVCILMLCYSLYHFIEGPYSHGHYALQVAFMMLVMVLGVTFLAPRISKRTKVPADTQAALFTTTLF